MVRTTVEILDSSLGKIAEIRALYPLSKTGMVLRYSNELSDYGTCLFRVSTHDPIFTKLGDILLPHKYHVRIKRGQNIVWQGAIVDNTQRNKTFIEVKAAEYEFYLDKVLIKRTSAVGYGEVAPTTDIGLHFRVFSTGTMATAVTNLINEAKAALGSAHLMSTMSTGTITNPNYPANYADATGKALTGAWNFTSDVVLQFDYQSVLYALKAFGIYAQCDFRLNPDLSFDFKPFVGNKNLGLVFQYGKRGNVIDYNAPRFGSKMINDYFGIATAPDGTVLHAEKTDSVSLNTYGLMQGAIAFSDVKDNNALSSRLTEDLALIKDPADSPMSVTLDENGYPLGQYGVGDLITIKINDGAINYSAPKRIVGITVNLHGTGRELTTIQTNTPKQKDLASI
jgi:hypothetical protein